MIQRNFASIKIESLTRLVMCHALSQILPLYIVVEYPKSGGTWLSQMLSSYFDIPFPRQCIPAIRSCVMHTHYPYNVCLKNVFCLIRDGRDVITSSYFHMLFVHERNYPVYVTKIRKKLPFDDYDDVRNNLPEFIEYIFTTSNKSRHPFRFSWSQFVRSWYDKKVPIIKYEDLLVDAPQVLYDAIMQVTGHSPDINQLITIVDKFSFANQAGRSPGHEDTRSFMRKGIAGDWRGKFSLEAREVFDHYAGEELILMGYEKDRSWVKQA